MAPLAALFLFESAAAQTMHLQGEKLFPAFDGWEQQADGSVKLWFGYFNENWEQEFELPLGPDNHFAIVEVGRDNLRPDEAFEVSYTSEDADQGQPTHFYPRRNPFLFTITLPEPEAFGGPVALEVDRCEQGDTDLGGQALKRFFQAGAFPLDQADIDEGDVERLSRRDADPWWSSLEVGFRVNRDAPLA